MPPPRDPKGRTERQVRRLVKERDLGRCARCGYTIYGGEMYSLQHRHPRGSGGSRNPLVHSAANQIVVCGSATTGCHEWMESNRAEALAPGKGWLLRQGDDPTVRPVLIAQFGLVLLDIDGGYTVLGNGF
jgi:hypothetical protein